MEAPSPARLYAAAAGVLLLVLGVVGFFYDASFGPLDQYEEALGALRVNGWLNLFYVATGSVGLLVAGVSSRTYSLTVGALFTLLAIVGWGTGGLNLAVGLLGLAAVAGTPRAKRPSKVVSGAGKKARKLKPRPKPAGKRA
ncbi:MAG: hypothetical protein QOF06_1451 [Solirubrobacterales bacterium]|jgi:hypothetical protein|nr:hypothetical protein [Solirubrobacterales bacterium]